MRNENFDTPIRNFKFKVFPDGSTKNLGMMTVTGLRVGNTDRLFLSRGIPDDGYLLFRDWLVRPPHTLDISVGDGAIRFVIENIEVHGLVFSDLDAGANALLIQTIRLGGDITLR